MASWELHEGALGASWVIPEDLAATEEIQNEHGVDQQHLPVRQEAWQESWVVCGCYLKEGYLLGLDVD